VVLPRKLSLHLRKGIRKEEKKAMRNIIYALTKGMGYRKARKLTQT